MDQSQTSNAGKRVVALTGTLTFQDHGAMRALIDQLAAKPEAQVVFDLSRVTALDSAGIGLLLLANDKLNQAGKTLTLTGAQGAPAKIIEVANLGEVIPTE